MDRASEERGLHDLFEVGLILKGIDGILELAGGVLLWLLSPATLNAIVLYFFRNELTEDPKDWLVNALLHITQNLTGGLRAYAAVILVVHGIVKLFLVAALLRDKLWVYPMAIAIFTGFIVWQFYQLSLQYSLLLWAITLVDIAVVALIAHEYREIRRRRRARAAS